MIVRLSELSGSQRGGAVAGLVRIFFAASSRQCFSNAEARSQFLETWTGWYIREAPGDVLLWLSDRDTVAGYLTGCRDSAAAVGLFGVIPAYDRFADLFQAFPAHLHVNVDDAYRSRGIGALLVEEFVIATGVGVHIVTGPDARNTGFYRGLGFTHEVERRGTLFMGRPSSF